MTQAFDIKSTIPMLGVDDIATAASLYHALGFEIAWEHGLAPDAPRLVSMKQDGGEIYLSEHAIAPRGGIVYILTDSVDALVASARDRGFQPSFGPEDRPWGDREAYFTDASGNVLRFGQHLD